MGEWVKAALDAAAANWHRRAGPLLLSMAIAGALIAAFTGLDLAQVSATEWIIIGIAVAAVWVVWRTTRIPLAARGTVGFGVALELEESETAKQLRADFIQTLRALLNQSKFKHKFSFVEFPTSVSRHISDDTDATKLATTSGVHFLLYGRARQRVLPSGAAHVIDIRGVVRHAPISADVRKQFAGDFGEVLPQRLIVGLQGG
jgi:hypothetical protein